MEVPVKIFGRDIRGFFDSRHDWWAQQMDVDQSFGIELLQDYVRSRSRVKKELFRKSIVNILHWLDNEIRFKIMQQVPPNPYDNDMHHWYVSLYTIVVFFSQVLMYFIK